MRTTTCECVYVREYIYMPVCECVTVPVSGVFIELYVCVRP